MVAAARLVSQPALIFAMRLAGAALMFLLQAAMARLWSVDLLGQYLLATAAINIAACAMPLGFQVVGSYFAAEYHAADSRRHLRAFARRAWLHIAIVLAFALPLVGLFAVPIGHALRLPPEILLPGVIMAAATAIVFVNGSLLVGARRPLAAFLADTLIKPLVMAAGFIAASVLFELDRRLAALIWVGALAYLAVALVHAAVVRATIARLAGDRDALAGEPRRWWRFAVPWMIISVANDFFFDIDLILLSPWLSIADLAVFGVCSKVFALVAFAVSAAYSVILPDMFAARRLGDGEAFNRKVIAANLVSGAIALAASLAMLASGPVLALFGPSFAQGAVPLAILCLGLALRSVLGPSALVLSLHDKPWTSLWPVAFGLVCLIVANRALVPGYGLVGAALAASLTAIAWAALQWLLALRHTGTDVSIWPWLSRALVTPRLRGG